MNFFKDVLSFDKMIVPQIITAVYWLGLVGVVIAGVMTIIGSGSLGGLLLIIFGALGLRIWCELLIVLFKINDNIQKIANSQTGTSATGVKIDA